MKNKKGFTLIELLAVIVVLAIIMIIAIPNILGTMSTSKKQSLKVYAEKMFNEAQKSYEEAKLSGQTPTTPMNISTLAPNQTKYKGCVIFTVDGGSYTMKINISDGDYKITQVSSTGLNGSDVIQNETSKTDSEATICARTAT